MTVYEKEYKNPYRNNCKTTDKDIDFLILDLRQQGMNFKEIGERVNLSRQRVHQIYSKAIINKNRRYNVITLCAKEK